MKLSKRVLASLLPFLCCCFNLHVHGFASCSFSFGPSGIKARRRNDGNYFSKCFLSKQQSSSETETTTSLPELMDFLGACGSEARPLLRLSTEIQDKDSDEGYRGVIVTETVPEGTELLRLPLSSCLRDDEPPGWLTFDDDKNYDMAEEDADQWATRLAASFVQLQMDLEPFLNEGTSKSISNSNSKWSQVQLGHAAWLTMLPTNEELRASLPLHWSSQDLAAAQCLALDMYSDAMYFSRGNAVQDLKQGWTRHNQNKKDPKPNEGNNDDTDRMFHDALDMVQTRVCRVELPYSQEQHENEENETLQSPAPPKVLRLLAPVFDFFNHGGSKTNAAYALQKKPSSSSKNKNEEPCLVVTATKTIPQGSEVFIHYGASAAISWRCLASYGFVPAFGDDGESEEDVAEVVVEGVPHYVTKNEIPFDLVKTADAVVRSKKDKPNNTQGEQEGKDQDKQEEEEEVVLTPEVASYIVAQLVQTAAKLEVYNRPNSKEDGNERSTISPSLGSKLAMALREAQRKVLVDCASGLQEYAGQLQEP